MRPPPPAVWAATVLAPFDRGARGEEVVTVLLPVGRLFGPARTAHECKTNAARRW